MTAVEAQAAGRPVVAYGQGGALETVVPGETGVFFHQPTAEALMEALVAVSRMSWDPAVLRANAARFNAQRFTQEMQAQIDAALAGRHAAAVT